MGIIPGAVTTEADRINSPFSNNSETGGLIAVGILVCAGIAVTSPVWLLLVPFKGGRRFIRCTMGMRKWGWYTGKGRGAISTGDWVMARESFLEGDPDVHAGDAHSPYGWMNNRVRWRKPVE